MFIVCCKNSFKTFIKNMPKKVRSEYHHITQKEWDEFTAKIPIAVSISMKQKDDIDFENKDKQKVKERCD